MTNNNSWSFIYKNLIEGVAQEVEFKVADEAISKVENDIDGSLLWIDLKDEIIKLLYQHSGHED